ncbi:MAG: hypothetical protein EBU82_14430 [Flavobacteriia bacterium]|jgi:hypothetical protein|nr:hypothetical protein [Flavobacteriia bacterium]
MKNFTLVIACFLSLMTYAQTQIGNSDMELWENVGAPTEEPNNWSSFKTGSGNFAGFANKQIERSSNVRAGATGTYAARIWSTSVLGIVANGTMTCGRVNMGSTTPSNPANYNYSQTNDDQFSEVCTTLPDSLVFWAKYTQAGGGNQTARVHAIVHDAYDAHDPIDANSQPHVLATAELDYSPTNGEWVRFSVPFVPTANTGLVPAFILTTFATNSTPGGGAANDEVLLDDISLVYNGGGAGIDAASAANFTVNYSEGSVFIHGDVQGQMRILALNGQVVFEGDAQKVTPLSLMSGLYVAQLHGTNGKYTAVKFSVN